MKVLQLLIFFSFSFLSTFAQDLQKIVTEGKWQDSLPNGVCSVFFINGNDCVNCYANANLTIDKITADKKILPAYCLYNIKESEKDFFIKNKLHSIKGNPVILNGNRLGIAPDQPSFIWIKKDSETLFLSEIKAINSKQLDSIINTVNDKSNNNSNDNRIHLNESYSDNSKLIVLSDDKFLTYNPKRGALNVYNYGELIKTVNTSFFNSYIDSLLKMSPDLDSFDIETSRADEQHVLSSFPERVQFFAPKKLMKNILLPISVVGMDLFYKTENEKTDTIIKVKWFPYIIVFDYNMNWVSTIPLPYQVAKQKDALFYYFESWDVISDSTIIMRMSSADKGSAIATCLINTRSPSLQVLSVQKIDYPEELPLITKRQTKISYSIGFGKINNMLLTYLKIYPKATYLNKTPAWKFLDNYNQYSTDSLLKNTWVSSFFYDKNKNYVVISFFNKTLLYTLNKDLNVTSQEIICDSAVSDSYYFNHKIYLLLTKEDKAEIQIKDL